MTKKKKTLQKRKVHSTHTPTSQVVQWMLNIQRQGAQQNYERVIEDGERLLSYLSAHAPERIRVLLFVGAAYGSSKEYARAYDIYTEAVKLAPNDADVWYNRGLASRFTSRFSQSLHDFERAAELDTGALEKLIQKELQFTQSLVEGEIKLRGPDFTFEQYAEQETLYHQALACMNAGKWTEAEEVFRATIDMGDCLPQPHSNLGNCLIMQERYDEAEDEFKRALAIDPDYQVAKQNLDTLPQTRRTGPPDVINWTEPFAGKVKVAATKVQQ